MLESLAPANQRVAFAGYFLVKSATQERHIRYAMDVSCPELGLKLRFTQRFSAYFFLRKRLIKTLKCCCNANSTFWIAEWGQEHMPRKCKCCSSVRSQVKKLKFPKRRLFTNVSDIEHRSEVLERFLNSILEILVDWQGDCVRGRRLFASVLSRFLGVNIARQISQHIHAKTDRRVIEDLRQTMNDMPMPTLSMNEFPPMPSLSEFSADAKDEEQEQQTQTPSECETEASVSTQKDETKANSEDNKTQESE